MLKQYKCTYSTCNYVCISKQLYTLHMQSHYAQKKYKCSYPGIVRSHR